MGHFVVATYERGIVLIKGLPGLTGDIVRWAIIALIGMTGHLLFTHSIALAELKSEIRHLSQAVELLLDK